MPNASCWKCYPDLDPGCIRPSSLLCDEHRTAEHDRLQALKDKYAHLTLEEQHKLWKREQREARRAASSESETEDGDGDHRDL